MTAPATRFAPNYRERLSVPYDHAAQSATASYKIGAIRDRVLRVDNVWYDNPTGFAADPAAYWTIAITDGTNTLASWSTRSTLQGALTADTPVYLLLNATHTDADQGSNLVVTFTKTGAPANLPAGRLFVDGHAL